MHSDKLYIEIGKAVSLIQLSDRLFKFVLLWVFPGVDLNSISLYQKNSERLNKATLGKLISTLKERVTLDSKFENVLDSYLKDRNSLIHNWEEIDDWKNESAAIDFTVSVQKNAAYLTYVFMAYINSWGEQAGLETIKNVPSNLKPIMEAIENQFEPDLARYIKKIT